MDPRVRKDDECEDPARSSDDIGPEGARHPCVREGPSGSGRYIQAIAAARPFCPNKRHDLQEPSPRERATSLRVLGRQTQIVTWFRLLTEDL